MCGCKQGTCPGNCPCGCRHTPPVSYICGCPTISNGDVRCHTCGEYVNKLCWKCKTPRGEGACPNPVVRITHGEDGEPVARGNLTAMPGYFEERESPHDGLTSNERATYQSMIARGYTHTEAYEAALDGVDVEDVRKLSRSGESNDNATTVPPLRPNPAIISNAESSKLAAKDREAAERYNAEKRITWWENSGEMLVAENQRLKDLNADLRKQRNDYFTKYEELRKGVTSLADYWARRSYVVCSNCSTHAGELHTLADIAEGTETGV